MKINITRRSLLLGVLACSALTTSPLFTPVVRAHEADCPVCSLPVIQDTATQDNEVKLRYGRKRLEYRCVYCALSDAQNELKNGDISIAAPSEKQGQPVLIKREKDQWSAPEGTLFAAQKANHRVCQFAYRAFHTRAGFDAWVKAHPDQFAKDAQPLTLAQMLKVAKP
jgi:hypothetical protein